jgi:hypothetical protein
MTASVIRGGSPNLAPTRGLEPNSGATTPPVSPGGQRAAPAPALAGRVSQGDTTQRPRAQLPASKTPGQVYTAQKAGPGAELNGKVHVGDELPVACWQFAMMAAFAPKGEKRSDTLKRFNTPESITEAVRKHGSTAELFKKYQAVAANAAAHQKHFVANEQLGGLLHKLAEKVDQMSVEQKGEARERLLIVNDAHEMEMDIQCKIEDDKNSPNYGKSYFAVSLTGLDNVNHHSRVVVSNPEDLKNLTMNDFMESDGSHVAVVNLNPEINLNLDQNHFSESKKSEHGALSGLMPAAYRNMPEVFNLAAKNSGPTHDAYEKIERFILLRGTGNNGDHAVHAMMNDTSLESIMAYGNLVLKNKNNLQPLDDVKLMIGSKTDAKTGDEFDALLLAVSQNQAGAIEALHKVYISLDTSEDGKELICTSALRAMDKLLEEGGDAKCYKALFGILKSFSPSSLDLAQNVFCFGESGAGLLNRVADNGDLSIMEAYMNGTKDLNLAAPETQDPDDDNSFENNQSLLMDMLGHGRELDGIQSVIQVALKSSQSDDTKLKTVKMICQNLTPCGLTPENAIKFLQPVIEDAVMSGANKEVVDTLQAALKNQQSKIEGQTTVVEPIESNSGSGSSSVKRLLGTLLGSCLGDGSKN